MKILVAGGSPLTLGIIAFLASQRHSVMLVDPDEEQCALAAQSLDHLVIHGEPWSQETLGRIRASQYDVLLAVTGRDENNLLTCELAKKLSFGCTIALIDNPSHLEVFHQLGVDQVICTPRIIHSFIAQALASAQEGKTKGHVG